MFKEFRNGLFLFYQETNLSRPPSTETNGSLNFEKLQRKKFQRLGSYFTRHRKIIKLGIQINKFIIELKIISNLQMCRKNQKNNDSDDDEYTPGRKCEGVRSYKFVTSEVSIC